MNGKYIVEPCMIGDEATSEDAEYIANYLTAHGTPATASTTEWATNKIEIDQRLWDAACAACAVAHNW